MSLFEEELTSLSIPFSAQIISKCAQQQATCVMHLLQDEGAASRRGPQGQYISPRAPHKVSGPFHAPHACAGDLYIRSAPRRDAWRQQVNACAGGGAWRMRHLPLRALIHKEMCVLPMLEHTLVRAHALHCRFMAPRAQVRTQRSSMHACAHMRATWHVTWPPVRSSVANIIAPILEAVCSLCPLLLSTKILNIRFFVCSAF
jgi:hypothetical protein